MRLKEERKQKKDQEGPRKNEKVGDWESVKLINEVQKRRKWAEGKPIGSGRSRLW